MTVGNSDSFKAHDFYGAETLATATSGTTYRDELATLAISPPEISLRDDEQYYQLTESTIDPLNLKQSCLVQLSVDKLATDDPIYSSYNVGYGVRVYDNSEATSSINIIDSSLYVTVTPPTIEEQAYDPDEDLDAEGVETQENIAVEQAWDEIVADLAGSLTQTFTVDFLVNNEADRPDLLVFNFETASSEAADFLEGDYLFNWATYYPAADSSVQFTVGCINVLGFPEQGYVENWIGSEPFSDAMVQGQVLTEIFSNLRVETGDYAFLRMSDAQYETEVFEDGSASARCSAVLPISKIDRDSAIYTDYTVNTGSRVYDQTDLVTFVGISDQDTTYTLVEPSYEFGDDFETDDKPYSEDVFNESRDFDVADYVTDAEGAAFQKFSGAFDVIPNFGATRWAFEFALEMPTELFDTDNWLYQWATYQDSNGLLPMTTVACAVQVNNPDSAYVIQYTDAFDSGAETTLPFWETNW